MSHLGVASVTRVSGESSGALARVGCLTGDGSTDLATEATGQSTLASACQQLSAVVSGHPGPVQGSDRPCTSWSIFFYICEPRFRCLCLVKKHMPLQGDLPLL